MNRKCLVLVMLAVALVGALGLAACSSSSSSSASASSSPSGASASESASSGEELAVVGIQAADAASFEFTNKSGKDIVAIAVKQAGTGEYPANMMADGLVVKSGDTVMLACPAIPEAGAADSAAKRLADIAISFADGSACELHEVDVHDIAAADLRLDGDVAYLEYTAAGTSKKVSTQDAEKAVAQQAADAAAQEEGTEGGSEDGGEAYEEEVYIDDSAVGDGDEESCVPDIVLR